MMNLNEYLVPELMESPTSAHLEFHVLFDCLYAILVCSD